MTSYGDRPVTGGADVGMRFALASLATWRLTHLLAEEDGPADVVLRLRTRLGPGRLGELMDCFYCLSIWVAAPLTGVVVRRRREAPLTWLALSAAACLLERVASELALVAQAACLRRSAPPTSAGRRGRLGMSSATQRPDAAVSAATIAIAPE